MPGAPGSPAQRAQGRHPSLRGSSGLLAGSGKTRGPSNCFNTSYGPNGPQNYAQREDPRFAELLTAIDNEIDPVKRQAAITAAEMVMKENQPVLPIS